MLTGHFELMLRRLKLTKTQREDLEKKMNGVAKCLHSAYYKSKYDGSTKYLIGSVGKRTNIRPPKDADILFKIPDEDYERFRGYSGNGPSALLQEVRSKLDATYPTSEKHGWVKVVAVEFSEGKHNVEVLPAHERKDGKFVIPNSKNGGSWEVYDARMEVEKIKSARPGIKKLIKALKHWRDGVESLKSKLSSYMIENFVLDFVKDSPLESFNSFSEVIAGFLSWLSKNCDDDIKSYVETALGRAEKANALTIKGDMLEACTEWRKIFSEFPAYDESLEKIAKLESEYPIENEEYIEDRYRVKFDGSAKLAVKVSVTPCKEWGRRDEWSIIQAIQVFGFIPKTFHLKFSPITNMPKGVRFLWKVRNFGKEAQEANDLRGEIKDGNKPDGGIEEDAKFYNDSHYVECYAVKDGVCVATARVTVPIGEKND